MFDDDEMKTIASVHLDFCGRPSDQMFVRQILHVSGFVCLNFICNVPVRDVVFEIFSSVDAAVRGVLGT